MSALPHPRDRLGVGVQGLARGTREGRRLLVPGRREISPCAHGRVRSALAVLHDARPAALVRMRAAREVFGGMHIRVRPALPGCCSTECARASI